MLVDFEHFHLHGFGSWDVIVNPGGVFWSGSKSMIPETKHAAAVLPLSEISVTCRTFSTVGPEVVGAEVVGAEVAGAEVVGAEVVGAAVVGAEVVGAEVVGAEQRIGSGLVTAKVQVQVQVQRSKAKGTKGIFRIGADLLHEKGIGAGVIQGKGSETCLKGLGYCSGVTRTMQH